MAFDAIVIGTGFGGTIAAVQLVAQGKKVLLLERGTFWRSSYPIGLNVGDPFGDWAAQNNMPVQYWPRPDHRKGLTDFVAALRSSANPKGLYQYSLFHQADVLTANGVGGGSLIYSNVTIRPKPEALARIGLNLGDAEFAAARAWMEGAPNNRKGANRGWLNYVVTKMPMGKDMTAADFAALGVDPANPQQDKDEAYVLLDRSRVLRTAARQVSKKLNVPMSWEPLELAIFEYDAYRGAASDSVPAHTNCERQGRCMLGCLPQARHTLNKTLFKKVLKSPGVELRPKSKVLHIAQKPGGYEVTYEDHFTSDGKPKKEFAPKVFLAGGVLGSTEILLRSAKKKTLPLSQMLGFKFSSNGDFGAFAYKTKGPDGRPLPVYTTRGPINTAHVTMNFNGRFIKIEDCAVPSIFAEFVSKGLELLDNAGASPNFFQLIKAAWESNLTEHLIEVPDTSDPNKFQTEAEMLADTFFFNVMSQDDATGRLKLAGIDGDQIDLGWEQPIAQQKLWADIEGLLREFSSAMGGKYLALPAWQGLLGDKKLTITHPLGGCPIGVTHEDGVVDEFGQVFDASQPAASKTVLPGLYVVDGAAIPGALAANPTWTISAQALKSVTHALAQAGAAGSPGH
ncbi:MAG TPA: GMC oxidoreductase [Candidatus Angelobacter sp.]|nr:GMC oxidoreductase [Candidatus Angelobacter sp.]